MSGMQLEGLGIPSIHESKQPGFVGIPEAAASGIAPMDTAQKPHKPIPEIKHTPGPWRAEQVRMGGPRNPYLAWSVQGKGGCVAEIRYTGIHPKNQIGEDEANARLIAAAPELLEALKAFVSNEGDAMFPTPTKQQYDFARAAISRATGK